MLNALCSDLLRNAEICKVPRHQGPMRHVTSALQVYIAHNAGRMETYDAHEKSDLTNDPGKYLEFEQ